MSASKVKPVNENETNDRPILPTNKTMKLSSTAFPEGGPIPKQSSRKGGNLSPPLSWSSVPENTKSLAIVVDDPDAPDPAHPKCVWVHWVAYNIPPGSRALPTGASGTVKSFEEGLNDWKHTGYEGPQPPKGTHRYFQ